MWLWIILIVISLFLYLFICGWLLPKTLLSSGNKKTKSKDYGQRRFTWRKSQGVEYLPRVSYRRYIRKYVILNNDNHFTLTYEIASSINYIDFDIMIFSQSGDMINVINIKDVFEKHDSHIKTIDLPDNVSYVSLVPRQANNSEVVGEPVNLKSNKYNTIFCTFSFVITLVEGFIVELCMANIFGGIFRDMYIKSAAFYLIPIAAAVLLTLIYTCILNANIVKKLLKLRNKDEY